MELLLAVRILILLWWRDVWIHFSWRGVLYSTIHL